MTTPSESAFYDLCESVDAGGAAPDLTAWPDGVRVAPPRLLEALRSGVVPASWPLVRTVRTQGETLRQIGPRPEWATVARVHGTGPTDDGLRFILETQSLWNQLHSLKCSFRAGDPTTAAFLEASPLLPRLRSLSLDCGGAPFSLTSLAAAPRLGRLGLNASFDDLRTLLERSRFVALHTLKILPKDSREDAEGAARLAASPVLERLRVLELAGHGPADAAAVLTGSALGRLREIVCARESAVAARFQLAEEDTASWKRAATGLELAEAFQRRPFLARLRHLSLRGHHLGDAGVERLTAALKHTRLTRLDLVDAGLGDAAAFALADCTGLRCVDHLGLRGNRIGPLGVQALAGSPYLTSLTSLDLGGGAETQPVGDQGVIALAGPTPFRGLHTLKLDNVGLTARGVAALAASRWLGTLRELDLTRNKLLGCVERSH